MFVSVKTGRIPRLNLKVDLKKPRKCKGRALSCSVVVLFGGDGDQLLGSLGDVVGALDDLLRDQLDVRGQAGLPREGLLALGLESVGTGCQQAQGSPHRVRLGFFGE